MDRENLDYWCEKGILGLVLALLVFAPLATGAVRPLEFLVVQALTLGILVLWLARFWLRGNDRILWTPICWVVLLFIGYAVFSYRAAPLEYIARSELLRVLVYGILFLAVLDNLHRQESTQAIAFALVFFGMAVSLYAIYQVVAGSPMVWHFEKPAEYWKRGSGTYICPNHFAGFLELILPLGLAYTIMGRLNHVTKVFLGYASGVMVAGIIVSLSRGGWIASALALLCFFGFLLKYRESRLPAILFLALLLAAGGYFLKDGFRIQERWNQLIHGFDDQKDIRFYLWKPAWEIWQDHLWVGAGPGHFDHLFPGYRPEVVQARPGWVHNDYLNTLADYGVIGAVLVLSALGCFYWGIFRSWKYVRRSSDIATKPSNRAAFVLGGAFSILAILLHSFVDFNMQVPANALIAVAILSLTSGFSRFATERYWVSLSVPVRLVFTLAGLAALVFLAPQWAVRAREYLALQRAEEQAKSLAGFRAELRDRMNEIEEAPRFDWERYDQLVELIDRTAQEEIQSLKQAHEFQSSNFETTYKIGESLRLIRWEGGVQANQYLEEAILWYRRGMELNRFNPYNPLRLGMCLDRLGRTGEAEGYYKEAYDRDPKNFFIVAHLGWHYFNANNYGEAKRWFEESLRLSDWRFNQIATFYLTLISQRETNERGSP